MHTPRVERSCLPCASLRQWHPHEGLVHGAPWRCAVDRLPGQGARPAEGTLLELQSGKRSKPKSYLWVLSLGFSSYLYHQRIFKETNIDHVMHITVIYYPNINKEENYTVQDVLCGEEGKAATLTCRAGPATPLRLVGALLWALMVPPSWCGCHCLLAPVRPPPHFTVPLSARCPLSPIAVSLSGAPLHYMLLLNETRGSQSPAPRGWVEENNLELEGGGRSRAWGRTGGVSNCYRKT